MIGKLIGKAVGEVIAAPLTVTKEILDAVEAIPEQTEKAVDRALTPRRHRAESQSTHCRYCGAHPSQWGDGYCR